MKVLRECLKDLQFYTLWPSCEGHPNSGTFRSSGGGAVKLIWKFFEDVPSGFVDC